MVLFERSHDAWRRNSRAGTTGGARLVKTRYGVHTVEHGFGLEGHPGHGLDPEFVRGVLSISGRHGIE